jgi:hypothetical protein
MIEKRLYYRLLIDTEIEHHNLKEDNIACGKTKDISFGGICITTEGEPLKKDDVYTLSFRFPGDDDTLAVDGRVVWVRKYKAGINELFDNGIEFISPAEEFRHMLEDFSIGAVKED